MSTESVDLKLTIRLMKWALAVGFLAAFTFGLWVKNLQSQVDDVPTLRRQVEDATRVMSDLVLLQCADTNLNLTERKICARYEPRMPR